MNTRHASVPRRNLRAAGFSLVEILISLAVLVILMLVVGATLATYQRVRKNESKRMEARQEVRAILDLVVTQSRRAGTNADLTYWLLRDIAVDGLTASEAADMTAAIPVADSVLNVNFDGSAVPADSKFTLRGDFVEDNREDDDATKPLLLEQIVYDWDGDALTMTPATLTDPTEADAAWVDGTAVEIATGIAEFIPMAEVSGAWHTLDADVTYTLTTTGWEANANSALLTRAILGETTKFRLRVRRHIPQTLNVREGNQALETTIYVRNPSTTWGFMSAISTSTPPWAAGS